MSNSQFGLEAQVAHGHVLHSGVFTPKLPPFVILPPSGKRPTHLWTGRRVEEGREEGHGDCGEQGQL